MRNFIVFAGLLIVSFVCFGQADTTKQHQDSVVQQEDPYEIRTLFGRSAPIGGYGGFNVGYTQIADNDGVVIGGRGGVIIGQGIALGIAGNGFFTDREWSDKSGKRHYFLAGGYGGLLFEPIVFPRAPIHFSFPIIIGGGGVAGYYMQYNPVYEYWEEGDYTDAYAYFVFEPGVELEFNLAKFMRLALGVSYRYTSDIEVDKAPEDVLVNWNIYMIFKFGKF